MAKYPFVGISIHADLYQTIDSIVGKELTCHDRYKYSLPFRSVTEFVEVAIREKLKDCNIPVISFREETWEIEEQIKRVFGEVEKLSRGPGDYRLEDGTLIDIRLIYQGGRGAFGRSIESLVNAAEKVIIIGLPFNYRMEEHIKHISKINNKEIKLLTIDDLKKMPSRDQTSPP